MYLQLLLGYGKKKKECSDPHLLLLSPSKMKEILIKLFDKIFPLCSVPGKCKWVHMWLGAEAQLWQAAVLVQDS